MKLSDKCRRIAMILSDVDGVLTDGRILLDGEPAEGLQFHIRDGLGIRIWQENGGLFGVVTGRAVAALRQRAKSLSIAVVRQGVEAKLPVVDEIAAAAQITRQQVCYVGDDLPDLPVVRAVGLGVAVADAAEEVRAAADYTTSIQGGNGAIREVIELVLKNAGQWDNAVRQWTEARTDESGGSAEGLVGVAR